MSENTPFSGGPVKFDPGKDIPLAEPAIKIGSSITEGQWNDVTGSLTELGIHGVAIGIDPLGWLIGAGLGFLVDVVQPLEDALGLVTGNGERLGADADKWAEAGQDLAKLATEIQKATDAELAQWSGTAGAAAHKRLTEFAQGVNQVAGEVTNLKRFLDVSKSLMDVAQGVVLGIIAQFVEWLIITWLTAQAAAPATLGASEAAAVGATAAESAVAVSRVTRFINQVRQIMQRLIQLLRRVQQAIGKAGASFARSTPGRKMITKGSDAIKHVPGTSYPPSAGRIGGIAGASAQDGTFKNAGWAIDQGIGMAGDDSEEQSSGGKSLSELLNPETPIDGKP